LDAKWLDRCHHRHCIVLYSYENQEKGSSMKLPAQIIIGSRGSDLALWQAHYVGGLLHAHYPGLTVRIEIIHTTGDKILDTSLSLIGGKGVFTKEIENALLERRIDIAVHSLKDLPTTIEEGLTIGAVPPRANVEDAFLAQDTSMRLLDLPDEATIATGSLRRKAQLLAKRPDFRIVDIRGNVPTRIRKMLESDWDGMVLASAGLERLGLTQHLAHTISLEWILPAVGQGALGIQCRSEDDNVLDLLAPLNDAPTLTAVTAERALLRAMGGGCQVPIGAFARVSGDTIELSACVAALNGESVIRAVQSGPAKTADAIGSALAETLLTQGGREILDHVYQNDGNISPELSPSRLQSNGPHVELHPEV
jgi:hydroxymethylbilane synthase